MKDNIIVFGGSFNPPTKAHIKIAEEAAKYLNGITIIVPVGNDYSKPKLIDFKYRIEMLNILSEKNPFINICDIEKNKSLKTIEVLNIIKEEYKNSNIWLLIGADNVLDLKNWFKYEEIIKNYNILAVGRNGIRESNFKVEWLPIDDINISSTMARNNLSEKYLNNSIINYIKKNNLYSKGE